MINDYNRSVICHIIGINPMQKDNFIKSLKEYHILDLDKFSSIIVSRKGYRKMKKLKNKSKIANYWKNEMNKKVKSYLKKHKNNNIIMIGLSSYHHNHSIRIPISTTNRFFISNNPITNAKNIIEFNLNQYHNEIINGYFPLKWLDSSKIIRNKNMIINKYKKYGYTPKSIQSVTEWILKQDKNIVPIYIASDEKFYDKKIGKGNITAERSSKRKLLEFLDELDNGEHKMNKTGYDSQWLSLVSSFKNSNKYFEKGYDIVRNEYRPYLKEKVKGSFDLLKTSRYLYKSNSDKCIPISSHKFKIGDNKKWTKKTFIPNVFHWLKGSGIKMKH